MFPFLAFALALTVSWQFMTAVFLIAMHLDDNSIVDVAYGFAFLAVAAVLAIFYSATHLREIILLAVIVIWALRLSTHIYVRNHGRGEDWRYKKWREEWGKTFVTRSFLQVFMLQGAIVAIIALPIILVLSAPSQPLVGILDVVGVGVWMFGFLFEAIGDHQLAMFKKDPANKGKIMRSGLWRYTRHPNYFGESAQWWGIAVIALSAPYGAWAFISPLLLTFLLLRVSGVTMLESKYKENKEYQDYVKRTSPFLPLPPK